MTSKFTYPTQFEISNIKIADQDVEGLFVSISLYEDIYRPALTGNIVIQDSDGAGFIEEQEIEFIEKISFSFKNALGDTLDFEGVMNGLRNEVVKGSIKIYTIDFTSESVRKNEQTFVVKAFRDANPEDIVKEMVELLDGELETNAKGKPMQYLGSRKRPRDIIEYVCTHGLSQKTQATEQDDSKEEEAKGTTGFLCWETLDGFKFESIDDISKGTNATVHRDFKTQLANNACPMDETMKSIVMPEFKQIGDIQTKMRSGAFSAVNISFDMDKGLYKEYKYYNEENMTEEQKKAVPEDKITRYFNRMIDNDKFQEQPCNPNKPLTGDQSRGYLNQNAGRQNTFSDQTGHFTLYPQFTMRAGDVFDCKIAKVKDEEKAQGGYDKKHSGQYIIQAVGHHLFNDGKAYTKIKTIRSTVQQDQATSKS